LISGKALLEKERMKLVKEGTYLNEKLKLNTTDLHEVYSRLNEIVDFSKKANQLLADELHSKVQIDNFFFAGCMNLVEMLHGRVQDADLFIENPVNSKLEQIK
jgi:hypothetical protein